MIRERAKKPKRIRKLNNNQHGANGELIQVTRLDAEAGSSRRIDYNQAPAQANTTPTRIVCLSWPVFKFDVQPPIDRDRARVGLNTTIFHLRRMRNGMGWIHRQRDGQRIAEECDQLTR